MSGRDELVGILERLQPRHGRDGRDGHDGRDGADGQPGERGLPGSLPLHDWQQTALRFEKQPGVWGESVDLRGERGERGEKGQDGRDGVHGRDGINGKDGERGATGRAGKQGVAGPRGPIGPMPRHEWDGTALRFELDEDVWGMWVDLRGPEGRPGRGGGGGGSIGGGGMSEGAADLRYLQLTGGSLTGALMLSGDPIEDLQAATKSYVDSVAAGGVDLSNYLKADGTVPLTGDWNAGAYKVTAGDLSGYTLQLTGTSTIPTHTPGGATVQSKVDIPSLTLGTYEQTVAMGIAAASDPTARVLSLFDARTVSHQPTLSVFDPTESEVVGFSWEGSSSDAYIKFTGDTLSFKRGTVILTASDTLVQTYKPLQLPADPINPLEAATKQYVDAHAGTSYTDEQAQDAIGAMLDSSLVYNDATPLLSRAALSGAITASAGSNTTALGSFTKAQLDTAVSDGNVLYVGDVSQYTDEAAQDAIGAMVDSSLVYTDATPLLSRAALTGAVTASAGSNTTALGSFTKAQLDAAVSDGNVLYVGDVTAYTDEQAQDAIGAAIAAGTQSGITVTYNDAANKIDFTVAGGGSSSAPVAYKNAVINGACEVWQRGASAITLSNNATIYSADRWRAQNLVSGSTVDFSRSTSVPTLAQAGVLLNYSLQAQVTLGNAGMGSTDVVIISQRIEGYQWRFFAQQALTLSFWIYSDVTGTYGVALRNSGTDRSIVFGVVVNAAATWEQKTINIPASPSAGTWDYTNGVGVELSIALMAGSTYQTTAGSWATGNFLSTSSQVNFCNIASRQLRITGVQLELGSSATQFQSLPFDQEQRRCLRFYEKSFPYAIAPQTSYGTGPNLFPQVVNASTFSLIGHVRFSVPKRSAATTAFYNPSTGNAQVQNIQSNTSCSSTQVTFNSEIGFGIQATTATSTSVGSFNAVHWTADAEL